MAPHQLLAGAHDRTRPFLGGLLTFLALASIACGAIGPPAARASWDGTIVATANGAIVIIEPSGSRTIFNPGGREFAQGAILEADGSVLAGLSRIPQSSRDGPTYADIVRFRPGSREPEVVVPHQRFGETLLNPTWLGERIAVAVTYPIIENGRYVDQRNQIDAIDLATGQRTTLVENAIQPNGTADGRFLAYVAIDPITYAQSIGVLEVASGRTLTVAREGQGFSFTDSPAVAPDGNRVLFAGAGPGPTNQVPRKGSWWNPFDPPVAAAHGAPQDIWLADLASNMVTRMTDRPEDQPATTWIDNERALVLVPSGIYLIDPRQPVPSKIADQGGAFGTISWRRLTAGQ